MIEEALIIVDKNTDRSLIREALNIASDLEVSVHILYIKPDPTRKSLFSLKSLRTVVTQENDIANEVLESIENMVETYEIEPILRTRDCRPSLFTNKCHNTITHYIHEEAIDLVIQPGGERSLIGRLLAPPLSVRIGEDSAVPVLRIPRTAMDNNENMFC